MFVCFILYLIIHLLHRHWFTKVDSYQNHSIRLSARRMMPMARQYTIIIIAYINQLIWSHRRFTRSSLSIMTQKVCSLGILMSLKATWTSMCSERIIRYQVQQVWHSKHIEHDLYSLSNIRVYIIPYIYISFSSTIHRCMPISIRFHWIPRGKELFPCRTNIRMPS